MSWSVPMRLQEKGPPFLALLAMLLWATTASAYRNIVAVESGTLMSCTSGCTNGCDATAQVAGTPATSTSDGTGSCDPTSKLYDVVSLDGDTSVVFLLKNTTATATGTVSVERSVDGGTSWLTVGGSANGTVGSVSTSRFEIPLTPAMGYAVQGLYRVVLTNCTGCNITVKFHTAQDK